MAKDYKGQVACILLRNTSSTDPDDKFPYDTAGFEGLDNKTYMFFNVPVRHSPYSITIATHVIWLTFVI